MSEKQKIVIVGAGPGGLSAAFFLTDPVANPGWSERYDVSVYQMGWRVGGKGATGRNPDACERIEEHGIHLFGSNYFNSFRMLQACYQQVEWDENDKFRSIIEAFRPSTFSYGMDYLDGSWFGSPGRLPLTDGNPWTGSPDPDPRDIVQAVLSMANQDLAAVVSDEPGPKREGLRRIFNTVRRYIGNQFYRTVYRIGLHLLQEADDPIEPGDDRHSKVLDLLEFVRDLFELYSAQEPRNPERYSKFVGLDLAITSVKGLIADDVLAKGIDSIDGENYYDWLARHGASKTLLSATSLQGIPNTALSYEYGDTTKIPTMSAAAYLTFALRALTGKGAGGYFFAEGTGETIMKPLYRLLVQRGVKFHFFHKLVEVVPDPERPLIDKLVFDVQATVVGDTYEPLRRIESTGELVWPDRPNYGQLAEGDRLLVERHDLESWWTAWEPVGSRELVRGRDFDYAVLATPVGTLEHIAPALLGHPVAGETWRRMTERIKTAATQAIQLWIDTSPYELGWQTPPGPTDRYVGATYGQDLTCFCDFSDLIEEECWPEDARPKGLLYFIGALPDPDAIPAFDDHNYPAQRREQIRWSAVQYLRNLGGLLPKSARSPIDPRSFDFDLLVPFDSSKRGRGVNQIDQQFFKANIDPNERYTLSIAGTVGDRPEAWGSKFDNLALAGDWIYTGYNVGSFEAAVMGGKLASLALTGAPHIDQIYGYSFLHPDRPGPDRSLMSAPVEDLQPR